MRLVGQVHITDIAAAPGNEAAVFDARNRLPYGEVVHVDPVHLLLEPAIEHLPNRRPVDYTGGLTPSLFTWTRVAVIFPSPPRVAATRRTIFRKAHL